MKLQNLNISYNSTHGYEESICGYIAKLIELSESILHLDISGLNIRNYMEVILKSLNQSKTLISIHMNDNYLDPKVRDHIMKSLGIET